MVRLFAVACGALTLMLPHLGSVGAVTSRARGCVPTVFAPAGAWRHTSRMKGPALVLSGGGLSEMPDRTVLRWMRRYVTPLRGRAGNLLILKASGGRDYSDDFYRKGAFASVQEVLIPPCTPRAAVNAVAPIVDRADAVLFSGGDQAHYAAWRGSALVAAVRRVYSRGGIVGGGSAGLAIQGQIVFDSVAADRVLPANEDVRTADAVRDPFEPAISFTTKYFDWPPLRDTITDTHFARRDRFGRSAAFMARIVHDRLVSGSHVYGIGVDEAAALLVDPRGVATLAERRRESGGYVPRGAYILQGGRADRIRPGMTLRYTVSVIHLNRAGMRYDLTAKRGDGLRYSVTVDGSKRPIYSRSPY